METKFTTMSQQAIGEAIGSASAAGNPQLEPIHLLAALLSQDGGVRARTMRAMLTAVMAQNAGVKSGMMLSP